MRDDLTHLIALTIDRSDWIISEISRGKRPYSPVPFLNRELLTKRDVKTEWNREREFYQEILLFVKLVAALIVTGECWAKTIADYNNKTMQYFVYNSPLHIPLVIFPCSYPP